MKKINRRGFLRGAVRGASVGVALPLLDCFLTDSGRAYADTKQRIPTRFGTWIWGCGFIPELWVPEKTGTQFDFPAHLALMEPYREKLALLTGFDVRLDGVANKPHVTGCLGLRTGIPVPNDKVKAPTLDVLIADEIGGDARFRSIEISTSGVPRSYSFRGAGAPNPSEISPLSLYQRLFGTGFQNPNDLQFAPDPHYLIQKSVLSTVQEDRHRLLKVVGAQDRHRLDEYFTAIREIEQKLAIQLQPPAPVENFIMPDPPMEMSLDPTMSNVLEKHKIMSELLARALQSQQTHVFNMLFSDTASNLRRPGTSSTHHTLTHEEPTDPQLGHQRQVAWFAEQSMVAWRDFLDSLSSIPEGDGTLLDNCIVMAHSDCSIAKSHAVEGIPVMIAGSGGGKVRTGFHLAGNGEPISRVGLTLQQVLGVQVEEWGTMSMATKRSIDALIA